MADIAIAFG